MALITEEERRIKNLKGFHVMSRWAISGDLRLDADYYAKEKDMALRIIKDSGFKTKSLSEVLKNPMYNCTRFRRIYTNDKDKGLPYLSATEALMFRPKSERILSREKTKDFEKLLVNENWILMTCSGIVGRLVIVSKKLSKYVLTHDLIRIIPDEASVPGGYLYAFLSTWIAQSVITRDQYGMVINHVEPSQLSDLPIPILGEELMNFINEQISYAYSLRAKAINNLDQAENLFYQASRLPPEIHIESKKSFPIKYSSMNNRLDASFHNPLVMATLQMLKNSTDIKLTKANRLSKIFVAPRFKRIYVEKEYGIPFLQGSDMPLIRPFNLKHISRKMTANIQNWLLKSGWVLVTCSGTIGKVGMVTPITDGWAASQHLLRVVTNGNSTGELSYNVDPGYIATFLSTPYGYNQVLAKTYGAVVDEIEENDIGEVLIAVVKDKIIHDQIAKSTREAYALKDFATVIEQETIKLLENILEGSITYASIKALKDSLLETIELKTKANSVIDIYESIEEISQDSVMSFDDLKMKNNL